MVLAQILCRPLVARMSYATCGSPAMQFLQRINAFVHDIALIRIHAHATPNMRHTGVRVMEGLFGG